MKYAIYLYFLWAAGKMAYFYYYKNFERKYSYRKWYVFSHWFSCAMFVGSCFCMALCFDAWSEGIEHTKFFWMGPSLFVFALGAFFSSLNQKSPQKKKSFVVANSPWKYCIIIGIDTG